jgi:caffeoyl-CoA O-methyltransferase
MAMTPERWDATCRYLGEVFGREDAVLASVAEHAARAGLPPIAVSADVGRLLMLLCGMTNGGRGARLALELGTLAGYSGVWIAGGLAPGGRLITVEPEAGHAVVAWETFRRAGIVDRVELRERRALEVLPELRGEYGEAAFDFVFLDAVKPEYGEYAEHAAALLTTGGLLVADNVLGSRWWIDDAPGVSADRDAIDRFNRAMALDARWDVACIANREGLMVARRRG